MTEKREISWPKNDGTHYNRKLGQTGRVCLGAKVSLPKKQVSIAGQLLARNKVQTYRMHASLVKKFSGAKAKVIVGVCRAQTGPKQDTGNKSKVTESTWDVWTKESGREGPVVVCQKSSFSIGGVQPTWNMLTKTLLEKKTIKNISRS